MRNFIISLICLASIVGIWCAFDNYASAKTQYYGQQIDTILSACVSEDDWDKALASFEVLQDDWNSYKQLASFFLDSSAINHIDNTFKKIEFYISADDKSNSSGELAYLNGLFEALYKNESLTPVNIF